MSEKDAQNLLFSGEIFIKTDDIQNAEIDKNLDSVNAQIESTNGELDRLISHANKEDYAVAISSGIITAVVDSVLLGEIHFTKKNIEISHKHIDEFVNKYAKLRGSKGKSLKQNIIYNEDNFKVAQDNKFKIKGAGIVPKNHHLADLAHHPTPVGMIAAIIVQFGRIGIFVNKNGKLYINFVDTNVKDVLWNLSGIVLSGIFHWLVNIGEREFEDSEVEVPEFVIKYSRLLSSAPTLVQIMLCIDNWVGHLVSDMAGSRSNPGKGMGIPGLFVSLLYEIAALPGLNCTGLTNYLNDLYQNKKIDMRYELVIFENVGKMSLPVILNDLITRSFYFISRFVSSLSEAKSLADIDFTQMLPWKNHTIDRMLTISSLSFTLGDTTDAAVRSVIEAHGNIYLSIPKFMFKFNYVGTGRASFAVFKEFKYETDTLNTLCKKRELTEEQTKLVLEKVDKFKAQLEELMCQYVIDDVTTFINGLNDIDKGLKSGDSDLVIKGNITIQNKLGTKQQFHNQEEFDKVIVSDESFSL